MSAGTATASKLDTNRFQKVRTLMQEGATAGERAAARSRAEAIAKAAGLSFAKACAKADAETKAEPEPVRPNWTDAFHDLFNSPEAKAERAERERKRQAFVRELLDEFGSEEAATEPCAIENALETACEPFRVKRETTGWAWGSLSGWDGGRDLPVHVRDGIVAAVPLPDTVVELWAEFRYWLRRGDIREAFCPNSDDPIWTRARVNILEGSLDTTPGRGFADVLARIEWMRHINNQGWSRKVAEDERLIDTHQADIERLSGQSGRGDGKGTQNVCTPGAEAPRSEPVQSGQPAVSGTVERTASGRRRAVLSILDTPDGASLSDREIARRVGVSPSTVGKLRAGRSAS